MAARIASVSYAADFVEDLGDKCLAFSVENNGTTAADVAFDAEGGAPVILPPGTCREFPNIAGDVYHGRISVTFQPADTGVQAFNKVTVLKTILYCPPR